MTLLTPEDYLNFPVLDADIRYSYGAHPEQFGDLYLPASAATHPVVILVHGGGYQQMYDLRPMGTVARSLAGAGFAVWNIEYRRAGNGGDYPQMFLDVAAAADFLPTIADRHGLNLASAITVGHSAGGHLALWLAGRRRISATSPLYRSDPMPLAGVVALAALADIGYAMQQETSSDALSIVMGGAPSDAPTNYRDASPRELLPLGVPQVHIVGSEDSTIRDNVRQYLDAAEIDGDAGFLLIPNVGHFEIVAVTEPAWTTVREAIAALSARLAGE